MLVHEWNAGNYRYYLTLEIFNFINCIEFLETENNVLICVVVAVGLQLYSRLIADVRFILKILHLTQRLNCSSYFLWQKVRRERFSSSPLLKLPAEAFLMGIQMNVRCVEYDSCLFLFTSLSSTGEAGPCRSSRIVSPLLL